MLTPVFANWFGISNSANLTPLLAVHILWINLVTDSLPALALAVDPAEEDIMERKPRKNSNSMFTGGMVYRVIYQGVMIGLITLIAFLVRTCI
jgi:Ca2+-transporting ATPase